MTIPTDSASEDRRLSGDQQMAVQSLHERALAMTALAIEGLRADSSNDFNKAVAVVMPLLGYAFETVAKAAWALHYFRRSGRMPKTKDLKKAATYPEGMTPFICKPDPDFDVGGAFAGHAVAYIIDGLTDSIDSDSAQALKALAGRPLHRGCLNAITAFHGFTRYALPDMLLDPDDKSLYDYERFGPDKLLVVDDEVLGPNKLLPGENERRFSRIVHDLSEVVASGYGDTLSKGFEAIAERHTREFLPALAVAYWELFSALSEVLADALLDIAEAQYAARLCNQQAAQVEHWMEQGWYDVNRVFALKLGLGCLWGSTTEWGASPILVTVS